MFDKFTNFRVNWSSGTILSTRALVLVLWLRNPPIYKVAYETRYDKINNYDNYEYKSQSTTLRSVNIVRKLRNLKTCLCFEYAFIGAIFQTVGTLLAVNLAVVGYSCWIFVLDILCVRSWVTLILFRSFNELRYLFRLQFESRISTLPFLISMSFALLLICCLPLFGIKLFCLLSFRFVEQPYWADWLKLPNWLIDAAQCKRFTSICLLWVIVLLRFFFIRLTSELPPNPGKSTREVGWNV